MMLTEGTALRARFTGGVLEPLEKVGLPEGKEVLVTVVAAPERRRGEGLQNSFGKWKGTVDAEKLKRDIYEDRLVSTRPVPKL